MRDSRHESLLSPSLDADSKPAAPIYSLQTGYLSSFIGGPIAASVIAGINSYRLRRLGSDAALLAGGVAASVALLWWEYRLGGNELLRQWFGASGPRIGLRAAGLAYFGLCYWVHRSAYRNMQIMGVTPPNGWLPGIAAVAVGLLTTIALTLAFQEART